MNERNEESYLYGMKGNETGFQSGKPDSDICPCCGNRTLDPEDSAYEICPVCFWENDPFQAKHPDETGANKVSLIKAKENFAEFGACEERFKEYVREPLPEEMESFEREDAQDE